jgi:hypothetical protein
MSANHLSIAIVWSDVHVLEIELAVTFAAWSGAERAYVTRQILTDFAESLDLVAGGATHALLEAGQSNMGFGRCQIFEYGGPRRLGMEVVVGHAGGDMRGHADRGRELRVSVPIERGQLSPFAVTLRELVTNERGTVVLPVPSDWP